MRRRNQHEQQTFLSNESKQFHTTSKLNLSDFSSFWNFFNKFNSRKRFDKPRRFWFVLIFLLSLLLYFSLSRPTKWFTTTPNLDADILIVGAGLSGSVLAHLHAVLLKKSSVIVEKREHLGGNLFDFVNEVGIRVSKYGAHLFHTKNDRVWRYVQQFTDWTPYFHRVVGRVDGKFVPIPVNIDTVNQLLNTSISSVEEMRRWLKENQVHHENPQNGREAAENRVGKELYERIFKDYTFKQWNRYPEDLAPSVLNRIPVRDDWDDRYFPLDPYQALPSDGYTPFMERMVAHPLITTHVNADFFDLKAQGLIDESRYEKIFFTGPIDAYFSDSNLPELEYRSINFETIHFRDMDYFGPLSVVNNPQFPENFTRHVEYKHLFNQHGDHTTIVRERSTDVGDPYYPVPNERNQKLYQKYQQMAQKEESAKKVYFIGRLASYKYFNMDQSILNAIENFETIYSNKNYDVEKMYGGLYLGDAQQIFRSDRKRPSVNIVIRKCNSLDIVAFVKVFGCRRMKFWTYSKCDAPEECISFQKSTSEHPFVSFLLSQQWNFADLNFFIESSSTLMEIKPVIDKMPTLLKSYTSADNKDIDVRGTNHFISLQDCDLQEVEDDPSYCTQFSREFKSAKCLQAPTSNWMATDAGLRRMLARHRTVLADYLRNGNPKELARFVPFFFNGVEHRCHKGPRS